MLDLSSNYVVFLDTSPRTFLLWKSATPFRAILLDSVAPDVNTSYLGSHLMSSDTCCLAFSTAFSASQPY